MKQSYSKMQKTEQVKDNMEVDRASKKVEATERALAESKKKLEKRSEEVRTFKEQYATLEAGTSHPTHTHYTVLLARLGSHRMHQSAFSY